MECVEIISQIFPTYDTPWQEIEPKEIYSLKFLFLGLCELPKREKRRKRNEPTFYRRQEEAMSRHTFHRSTAGRGTTTAFHFFCSLSN